ncbi:hypothetical protein P5V15_011562 [Pogonomyrmex californicus]
MDAVVMSNAGKRGAVRGPHGDDNVERYTAISDDLSASSSSSSSSSTATPHRPLDFSMPPPQTLTRSGEIGPVERRRTLPSVTSATPRPAPPLAECAANGTFYRVRRWRRSRDFQRRLAFAVAVRMATIMARDFNVEKDYAICTIMQIEDDKRNLLHFSFSYYLV